MYKFRLSFLGILLLAGCITDETYTLYRSSVSDENARVHVATFDAVEGNDYNSGNCDIAKDLFASQEEVKVTYWCEKGSYKK